jgi:uncharacterized OB-fold protein
LTRPFWDACADGRLLFQQCGACAAPVFIPQELCPRCWSTDLHWRESSGRGRIVTFTVVWRGQTPAFETPYVVAVIRLEEGHEMMTNIVGADPAPDSDDGGVRIGAPVRVVFEPTEGGIALPCFELVDVAGGGA